MQMKIESRMFVTALIVAASVFPALPAGATASFCTLDEYKASTGLTAANEANSLLVTWEGRKGQEARLRFTIVDGTPTIQDISVRHQGGAWTTLASRVTPEFRVTTGRRRLDQEAYPALKIALKGEITQAVLDHYKWDAFWDAPLRIPGDEIAHGDSTPPPAGIPGTNQLPLPRTEAEVTHATATYKVSGCAVKTDGERLEISFPGVKMGTFSGRLQYTVYKGTGLLRQEVVATTSDDDIAYKYDAGLKGLAINPSSKLVWRDTAYMWQDYQFGSPTNHKPATVRAANRVLAAQSEAGAIATFPPPHNFFWTREISVNLGYTWYRKDSDTSFSFGVREADSEADPAYAGRGPEDRRQNFALYNARPGTEQRMPVYFEIGAEPGQATIEAALAYTRNDHYQALPGYWIMARHFHTSPIPRLLGLGGLDTVLPDYELARATGINIFGPVGAGGLQPTGSTRIGPRQNPTGPNAPPVLLPGRNMSEADRLKMQSLYYQMARVQSRKDFLVMPNEELFNYPLPAHNDLLISHPTYWVDERKPGEPFVEDNPTYGKVYHIGSPVDLMEMAHQEDMFLMMPHPDTKGSAGYPAAFKDQDYFKDARYGGIGFRWGMGVDRSEKRLSDYRCMPLFDEMNNWVADLPTSPKYMDAITETYEQGPGDDFYANNPVSYIKVEGQPGIDNWKPVIDAMMKGNYFVTSGEVLIPAYSVEGTGSTRTISADVEWTFPLEFAEVVWGDGQKTDRQIISVTDLPAFGKHQFRIPFDAAGKKWVRFAVWDSAGNGAFVQPIKLNGPNTTARNLN
jgi:hypothetical protein